MKLVDTLCFIMNHPLNRDNKTKAVSTWLRWQVGSRLVPGPVAVPFVNETRLLVSPGMTGATGNVYAGLHEFSDMSFLLHFLRPGDLFFDIGANIGSYTILASAAVGARTVALEPIPSTYSRLYDNIRLNGVEALAKVLNAGAGKKEGVLRFTAGLDTVNHVVDDDNAETETIEVQITTLDSIADRGRPILIKIDVEGYETNVVAGGEQLFASGFPEALIMEANDSANRYGFDEISLHKKMLNYGFKPFSYFPFERRLISLHGAISNDVNILYVRNVKLVENRLTTAPKFRIRGNMI